VICAGEVNQEESEQDKVDGMKKELIPCTYLKERLVICNEEGTDGRARVITDEAEEPVVIVD